MRFPHTHDPERTDGAFRDTAPGPHRGILSGFDRLLFRGTLRSIAYVGGLDIFLSSQHVLYKDFATFALGVSDRLKAHAEAVATHAGRPFRYVVSSRQSKEDLAREILRTNPVVEGLICVLSCVEPCQSFTIRRDRATHHLQLTSQARKCLHLYFYYLDRDFGLMHVRVQTWLPCTIQVCVNGREWLARQLTRARLGFQQADNAFVALEDPRRAQALADQLIDWPWQTFLQRFARQLNPWACAKRTGLKPVPLDPPPRRVRHRCALSRRRHAHGLVSAAAAACDRALWRRRRAAISRAPAHRPFSRRALHRPAAAPGRDAHQTLGR